METQERIATKAHELFTRYGIRSVSMDEIANHLGMSKKTIYQFYADKDALVEDVINITLNENKRECSVCKENCENAIHEIFMAVDMMQEMLSKMNPTVIFDIEKHHPKAFKKYSDYKNKFLFATIRENIEWGIREGLYREDIQVDILARFRLASTFILFNPEIFPEAKNNIGGPVKEITDNFLYGMATAKGQKLIQKYKQQRLKP